MKLARILPRLLPQPPLPKMPHKTPQTVLPELQQTPLPETQQKLARPVSRRCAGGFRRVILWPTTSGPKTPPSITAKGIPAGTGKSIH